MIKPLCTPDASAVTFKDEFNARRYDNNDGDADFSGPWIEDDVENSGGSSAQSPTSGNVLVGSNGYAWLDDNPNTGTQPSLRRAVDLAGRTSAVLSFEWLTHPGVDASDKAEVSISSNGGSSYTVLKEFTGFSGEQSGAESFDISAFISPNTVVRVRITNLYGGSDETFKVDNVMIVAQ